MISDIKLFDSSFSIRNWDAGDETLVRKNEWMDFDAKIGDTQISFTVTFDIEGTCKWSIEKGDYIQPDFIEQSDVDITIDIKEFWSEEIEVDLTTEVKNLLVEKIKTNL